MFQRRMMFSENSSLEVSTRIFNGEEVITLSLKAKKNEKETTVSSAILTDADAKQLIGHLQDIVGRNKSWPIAD